MVLGHCGYYTTLSYEWNHGLLLYYAVIEPALLAGYMAYCNSTDLSMEFS